MSIQISTPQTTGITSGFGQRLKEERKRLKLSQTELAQLGGVGRLAQSQYESEATGPTTRYLSAIGAAGVDLAYLIFGTRQEAGVLSPEQQHRVECRAFDWIERCAETQPDGRMSAEARRLLYQMIRSVLVQIELGKLPADFNTDLLMSQQIAHLGKR